MTCFWTLFFLASRSRLDAVGLAVLAHQVGMRGAQHDIDDVGKLGQDLRQRLEHVLDALVGREQAEGEQHQPAFHAELVLVVIRDRRTGCRGCRAGSDQSWLAGAW